ncbi:hypothetical protein BHE74_00056482, partial [Ensete ventricosum]
FIVQLRSLDDHSPLPGIVVGDIAHINLSTWFIGIPDDTYRIEKGRGAEEEKENESNRRRKKRNGGAEEKKRRMRRWRIDRRGEKGGGELQEME